MHQVTKVGDHQIFSEQAILYSVTINLQTLFITVVFEINLESNPICLQNIMLYL